MRQIVLDTETTGLDPASGHRLVEIACVEIVNLVPTGEKFHAYLDPQRNVPEEAFRIHGLSAEFLAGKPRFGDIYLDFLSFVGDSCLVIHNAEFDMKFINSELRGVGAASLSMDRVLDTLAIARKKHPGASNSLDALCARYRIDNSKRTKHGALLDSEILAELYMELMGGRQTTLVLPAQVKVKSRDVETISARRLKPQESRLELDELDAHARFARALGDRAIWLGYLAD